MRCSSDYKMAMSQAITSMGLPRVISFLKSILVHFDKISA